MACGWNKWARFFLSSLQTIGAVQLRTPFFRYTAVCRWVFQYLVISSLHIQRICVFRHFDWTTDPWRCGQYSESRNTATKTQRQKAVTEKNRVVYFSKPFFVFRSLFPSFFYLSSFFFRTHYLFSPPSLCLPLSPIFPFFITTFLLAFPSISLVYRVFLYSNTLQYSRPLYEYRGRKSTSLTNVFISLSHLVMTL